MKSLVLLFAITFSIVSMAADRTRILAVVNKAPGTGTVERIELLGINLGTIGGPDSERYVLVTTSADGCTQEKDVTQFSSYLNSAGSYLRNKDSVQIKVINRKYVCYLASPDHTSTLSVERYSESQKSGGVEMVLGQHGCQTGTLIQPVNSGDYAVAEGLLKFIEAAAQ